MRFSAARFRAEADWLEQKLILMTAEYKQRIARLREFADSWDAMERELDLKYGPECRP